MYESMHLPLTNSEKGIVIFLAALVFFGFVASPAALVIIFGWSILFTLGVIPIVLIVLAATFVIYLLLKRVKRYEQVAKIIVLRFLAILTAIWIIAIAYYTRGTWR